ncbi:MAG: bifunctional [glutamate--ammonia ligase]-adenylyl-L-tyrosine phosphorylase/[glutamate--ammonia-ligase] adenylyltransferase [Thermodesulfobacteriota bacterium]
MAEERGIATLSALGFEDGRRAFQNLTALGASPLRAGLPLFVKLALNSPSPDDALNNLERIASTLSPDSASSIVDHEESLIQLITLCGSSQMLTTIIAREPAFLNELLVNRQIEVEKGVVIFTEELGSWIGECREKVEAARLLRRYRHQEYLRIGARDLLDLAPLKETTAELSGLASASLEVATNFCLRELKEKHGAPLQEDDSGSTSEAQFVVMGMGKLGGGELNFNSDIDIIYLYSSDRGATSGSDGHGVRSIDLHTFFVRLSEMVTKMVGAITEDGCVFRVDLDLRPEGTRGPITNSLRSAEIYYESWGQSWERAAMIKARPVAGSTALGEKFLAMIEPFVYRRHLDFTAIEEIRAMKERIDLSLLRKGREWANVKLGRGGIREIEFFIQALQLIHGGKDRLIRLKSSLDTIRTLAEREYIEGKDAVTLTESYIFLRNLEHRIQIVEGRQSHTIPEEGREVQRLAKMMGFLDKAERKADEALMKQYGKVTGQVHETFENLFYQSSRTITDEIPDDTCLLFSPDMEEVEGIERLGALGFQEPGRGWEGVKLLRDAPPFAHLSPRAHLLLGTIGPFLLYRAEKSPDPDRALDHIGEFLAAIGGRDGFYSLLAENRAVMLLLVKIFSTSLFLSRAFIEHPENIEILFSRELNRPEKSFSELYQELDSAIRDCRDFEESLDVIRRFCTGEVIRIGINDLSGTIDPVTVSEQLSTLADVALKKAYELAWKTVTERFGRPTAPRFTIIALGKLGGHELRYSSDLDIIFINDSAGEETDGPRVVSSREFFAKVAQQIITILSTPTREGIAFKVDTRLRPSGNAGPLVTTSMALLRYHREVAEVWERQPMTKARFVCGSEELGMETLEELHHIVFSRGADSKDIAELYRIRERMEREIARETPDRLNIKTGYGGMVDIEFLVQTLQLQQGGDTPSLITPNTLEGIEKIREGGALAAEICTTLSENYTFYMLMENRLRILHNNAEGELRRGSRTLHTLARALGYVGEKPSERLLEEYTKRTRTVRDIYMQFMEGNQ